MVHREASQVTKALNEWAVIVKALGEGRQICLIRKNRIASHQEFALYPTYSSQRKRAIQDSYQDFFKEAEKWERDGHTEIRYWAALDRVIEINDVQQLTNLNSHYIWEPSHVEDYCAGKESVFLVLVRVYKLDNPQKYQRKASTSIVWRNLEQPLEIQDSRPVLTDDAFAERVASVERDLGRSGTPEKEPSPVRKLITPSESPHDQLKKLLHQVGTILGYHAEVEFHSPPHWYDVVWQEFPEGRATHAFEVQDEGNLTEALAKLQHAKDIWGSQLFLVVTGERDQRRLEKLVGPLLAGTFHRLRRELTLLTPENVEELHGALEQHKDILGKMLPL